MGNTDSKINFRKAVIQLTSKNKVILLVKNHLIIYEIMNFKYNLERGRQ
jgi:hypothetical protein